MKKRSMKKALMALALFAVGMTAASAENLQDVVYLKNGSVIRGIIIEQVPSESIKIQIAGGSVLVLKTDEVSKITKEGITQESASGNDESYGWNRAPRYRGFVGESVLLTPMATLPATWSTPHTVARLTRIYMPVWVSGATTRGTATDFGCPSSLM